MISAKPPRYPLKKKLLFSHEIHVMKSLLRSSQLHTVCEEARCPNVADCFGRRVATFMILGDSCTRKCGFCGVSGSCPTAPDPHEPQKVASAARQLGLGYVVVTSVTRDDLPDLGAGQFKATILSLKEAIPRVKVEVLVPDFMGRRAEVEAVTRTGRPDVFNHNVETVPRLYPEVRPQADFSRSLSVLRVAKETLPEASLIKSGIMLGLGEEEPELVDVFRLLREAGCDVLTIGQYFRPSFANLPVERYYQPEEFERLRRIAAGMGFSCVASGPYVRSSFNAEEVFQDASRAPWQKQREA